MFDLKCKHSQYKSPQMHIITVQTDFFVVGATICRPKNANKIDLRKIQLKCIIKKSELLLIDETEVIAKSKPMER